MRIIIINNNINNKNKSLIDRMCFLFLMQISTTINILLNCIVWQYDYRERICASTCIMTTNLPTLPSLPHPLCIYNCIKQHQCNQHMYICTFIWDKVIYKLQKSEFIHMRVHLCFLYIGARGEDMGQKKT